MSRWEEVKKDHLDYDPKNKEIEIYAGYDDWGSRYVTVKLDLLVEFLRENKLFEILEEE